MRQPTTEVVRKLNNCMFVDMVNICITTYNYNLLFCSVGRQGHATVHAMIEMHGRHVIDVRSREGFYSVCRIIFMFLRMVKHVRVITLRFGFVLLPTKNFIFQNGPFVHMLVNAND